MATHEHTFGIEDNGKITCWCGAELVDEDYAPRQATNCRECGFRFYGAVGQLLCDDCSQSLGVHEEDLDDE